MHVTTLIMVSSVTIQTVQLNKEVLGLGILLGGPLNGSLWKEEVTL